MEQLMEMAFSRKILENWSRFNAAESLDNRGRCGAERAIAVTASTELVLEQFTTNANFITSPYRILGITFQVHMS